MLRGESETSFHVALVLAKRVALLERPAPAGAALLFDDAHRAVLINFGLLHIDTGTGRCEAVLLRERIAFFSMFRLRTVPAALASHASAGSGLSCELSRGSCLLRRHKAARFGE